MGGEWASRWDALMALLKRIDELAKKLSQFKSDTQDRRVAALLGESMDSAVQGWEPLFRRRMDLV